MLCDARHVPHAYHISPRPTSRARVQVTSRGLLCKAHATPNHRVILLRSILQHAENLVLHLNRGLKRRLNLVSSLLCLQPEPDFPRRLTLKLSQRTVLSKNLCPTVTVLQEIRVCTCTRRLLLGNTTRFSTLLTIPILRTSLAPLCNRFRTYLLVPTIVVLSSGFFDVLESLLVLALVHSCTLLLFLLVN